MTTSLTGKNQVTVPAEIVKQLGLEPGAKFDWSVSDEPGLIVVRVQPSRSQLLQRLKELTANSRENLGGRDPVAELIAERELDMELEEQEEEEWRNGAA